MNTYTDTGHSPNAEKFTDHRLENIGRLVVGGLTNCTGTLIPPDLVVTNAHCFVDEDGQPLNLPYIFKTGGYTIQNGESLELDLGTAVWLTSKPLKEYTYDLALVKLKHNVRLGSYLPVEIASITSLDGFDTDKEESFSHWLQSGTRGRRCCHD